MMLALAASMDDADQSAEAAFMQLLASSAPSDPAAPAVVERLRSIVGDAVPRGGLERLLRQSDGNVEMAFELFCTNPEAYATEAPQIDLESGVVASSIEGVWETALALLPPEHAFGADDASALGRGDRILLPHAALSGFLDALMAAKGTRLPPTPICVRLTMNGVSRVCGIADWSAPEGSVVLPQWLLDEFVPVCGGSEPPALGDRVRIESADVPRATSLTLRPLGQAIRRLTRERQVELLTIGIQDIFTNVRQGDHLEIAGDGGGKFEVVACRGRYDDEAGPRSPGGRGVARAAAAEAAATHGLDARQGVPHEAVCVVASDNQVLEFDLELEESLERETSRRRFDAAREAYRETLGAAAASSRSSLLVDDADAREQLRALVNAADEAVGVGVTFGEELELARQGLRAADRVAEVERMAREAQAQAEAAREAEAARLAQEAIDAQAAAEKARAEAVAAAEALQARFHNLVPVEPEAGGAPVRVQWPHGGAAQRRFEPTATLEQVRAWVMSAYPVDAPSALTESFVLKTRPMPGTPSLKLGAENKDLTVEAAGLGGQVLMFDDL